MSNTEIGKPTVTPGINAYSYRWEDLALTVSLERLSDKGIGEICVVYHNGTGVRTLAYNRIDLLSPQAITQLISRLKEHMLTPAQWSTVLTYVSSLTMQELRKGEPVVRIGEKPETLKREYQLYPILERNEPTTIFAPGGTVKSYLADYIACLVQGGRASPLGWVAQQGNVLYLDWESCRQEHERRVWAIKQGLLGIDATQETFLYRECSQPLVSDVHQVQKIVSENEIALTIADSQMAASGWGPDAAQLASQYYNALRSLKCTTLTLDHVTKHHGQQPGNDSVGPYGSVVKFNRARSLFELEKQQDKDSDTVALAMRHRKHNGGRLLPDIGISVQFYNDPDGNAFKVEFTPCNLVDNPELAKSLPEWQLIQSILKNAGKLKPGEIAEQAKEIDPDTKIDAKRAYDVMAQKPVTQYFKGILHPIAEVVPYSSAFVNTLLVVRNPWIVVLMRA